MSDRVETVVIGHHPLVREGLVRILPADTYEIVAQSSEAACVETGTHAAACPILCLLAAGESRAATAADILAFKEKHPLSRVVVLALRYDLMDLASALRAGAQAYLLDTMSCEAFLKALELILLGECVLPSVVAHHIRDTWTSPEIASPPQPIDVVKAAPRPRTAPLSCRESEILECLAEGASNKVIARRFDIAEATVKVHLKAILRKLGARNRTQAALWSVTHLQANGTEPLNTTGAISSTGR